jgi:AmmeMemoRadiSam system protein A
MGTYSKTQQDRILQIAHSSILLFFENQKYSIPTEWQNDSVLFEKRGTFVTLSKNNSLRGCIGSILPGKPMWLDISENAVHAAFHDPRFEPLEEGELAVLSVEVSVLTVPVQVNYLSFQELEEHIRPLIDGVIIQAGYNKATFLPQVWEDIPVPTQFFKHLSLKAGLPGNFFQTRFHELTIFTYQADIIKQGHEFT